MRFDLPKEAELAMYYGASPGNKYRTKKELRDQDWKTQAAHGYENIPKGAIVEFKDFMTNFYGVFAKVIYKNILYYVDYNGIEWAEIVDEEKEIKRLRLLGCDSCKHFSSDVRFFCKLHELTSRNRYECPCTDFERG